MGSSHSLGSNLHSPVRWALVAVSVCLVLTACGGDNDRGSDGGVAGRSSGAIVGDAKAVTSAARNRMVYSTVYTPTKPSQIVSYGTWRGPTTAPKPKRDVTVEVIPCAKTAIGCMQVAQAMMDAARVLGWKADLIDGRGSVQGFAQAFNAAFSRKPDVIAAVGLPTVAVGDSLAKARARGILTADMGDIEPASGEKFDVYVPYPSSAMAAIAAWTAISDSDGHANGLVIRDTDYPLFVASAAAYEDVMRQCEACTVEVVDWRFPDALDPTKVSRIVGGALSRVPDATVIHVPYGSAMVNVTQAVAHAGGADQVEISSQGGDPLAIRSVVEGDSDYTAGTSGSWLGWAAIDQINRGLAGAPYLDPTEIGLGIFTFTAETAPDSGNYDEWPGMVDYKAHYKKIWGVD